MNIPRKIMLYAIITALSVIVFNRVDDVFEFVSAPTDTYNNIEELDEAYEQDQSFRSEICIDEMPRSWMRLDAEFAHVMLILGVGMIASIMLRLRE